MYIGHKFAIRKNVRRNEVIGSYDDENESNQVLVQPKLSDVSVCGVAFTIDPNTLGNYYVINYDDHGFTSAVTSGNGSENKLYYRFKKRNLGRSECVSEKDDKETSRNHIPADWMEHLCLALRELKLFLAQENLDVEFAFTKMAGTIYFTSKGFVCLQETCRQRDAGETAMGK